MNTRLALWLAPLIGPLAWLLDLEISFSANRPACEWHNAMPLHLATLVTLSVALLGVWLTWRQWRHAGPYWPGEEEGEKPRSRFLSFVGLGGNLVFVCAILAQAVPKLMLGPCQ